MAKCAFCSSMILFGGVTENARRFCGAKCLERQRIAERAAGLPEADVARELAAVHRGLCPKCHGPGPCDVYTSHRVVSALVVTRWWSRLEVCCRGCGVRNLVGDAVFSFLLGWWAAYGIILTPVQVGRNLYGLTKRPDPSRPSPRLAAMVRMQLATKAEHAAKAAKAA